MITTSRLIVFLLIVSIFVFSPGAITMAVHKAQGYDYFVRNQTYSVDPVVVYEESSHSVLVHTTYDVRWPMEARAYHNLFCDGAVNHAYYITEWAYPGNTGFTTSHFMARLPSTAVGKHCFYRFDIWVNTGYTELQRSITTNTFFVRAAENQ